MTQRSSLLASLVSIALTGGCSSSSSLAHGTLGDGGGGKSSGESHSQGSGGGATSGTGGGSGTGEGSHAHSGPSGSSSASSTGTATDGGESCLGASMLASLGKTSMIVGIGASEQPTTATLAPFDAQYVYISGGLPDGTGPCASCAGSCTTGGGARSCASSSGCAWWGCWQYDQDPPGDYVRGFASTCAGISPPQVPMITYYQILQSSGVDQGAPEVMQAATDAAFMGRYFADWRFLLQQIGSTQALLHIEPDFWGFAQQITNDPTSEMAAVASANPTDCGMLPNTIAGMGQCMVAMVRKYAPKAMVGLHASTWSTNVDVSLNNSTSLDVAGEAAKTAAFLAAAGESDADFVVVETSDRDAGYYQTAASPERNTWWDDTNATLPNFHQDFAWVQALTTALQKPALYWQTPLGNSAQNNTPNHYKDNRVDYFFAHFGELAAAHAVGAMFGAGAGDQTEPETDGNNLIDKTKTYHSGGGQSFCQ